MTVQLVRPTSLPYEATGALLTAYMAQQPNITATLSPTWSGDGSMSDDSDATGATMQATQNAGGNSTCTVLAVDFGPITTSAVSASGLGTMFRYARAMTAGTGATQGQYLGSRWLLFDHGNVLRASGSPADFVGLNPTSSFNSIPDVPTTYESGPTDYAWAGDTATLPAMFSAGFTLAWDVEATTTATDYVVTPFRFTELGLYLDYGGATQAPPCQLYPRDDNRGVGGAAIWPPPSSGRPGGYY